MMRVVSGVFVVCLVLAAYGCSTISYYARSINGQLDVLGSRVAISELLAAPDTPDPLRENLKRVLDIRDFASTKLALPDNNSYRLYADLKRPYAVWAVFAAPEFSLELEQWCFLIVGCVNYRGYFSKDRAIQFAEQLSKESFDTYVADVPAYSTLGWFDDPITNTVIDWPEATLAALIFHELAHQTVYIKDDSGFNESFATAVAEIGVERWLASRPKALSGWHKQKRRRRIITSVLLDTREQLKKLYESKLGKTNMRQAKKDALDELKRSLDDLRTKWQITDKDWFRQTPNNARLGSAATYHHFVPAFHRLFQREAQDMKRFYAAVTALGDLPRKERYQTLKRLMPANNLTE
ncbi:MAG: aminopeptidase [Gammaproteobacteria bacterium]|nr:MAG: aminopeptidase [Gammaproteobacteria bacterium]